MCGIIIGFKNKEQFQKGLQAASHRGPDNIGSTSIKNILIGHTRLKILDTSDNSNQPFKAGKVILSYNGELWNYKELRKKLEQEGKKFKTSGDVEVVARALDTWGVDALKKFDGMFGLTWWDGKVMRAARDVFGEVPLYYSPSSGWVASEQKILRAAEIYDGELLDPGSYIEIYPTIKTPVTYGAIKPSEREFKKEAALIIRNRLKQGVLKKSISDVPVCCLLSGGIDSSLILSFLKMQMPNIVAYTAVYNEKSLDLKRAREVAEYLDIELREVPIPTPTIEGFEEVIKIIEIPYKAQVEIGWACLHLAKQMNQDGFKVTFSGEGADEMFGSYGFSYHALAAGRDWGEYRLELFTQQHRKNFLRCNKIFMSQGVECRLPFLHKPLVEYVVSLPLEITGMDKAPLKQAAKGLLPDNVINRPKVAFQDGLGVKKAASEIVAKPRSFYQKIYEREFSRTVRKGFF
jgi:asparagine synthase (glutamine-hydrolysing)